MPSVASSRTAPSPDLSAEIVRATKITTAQASPVVHYRSRSRSSTSFSAEDSPQLASAASGSARVMPSPIPPPCAALPPTPGIASPVLAAKAYRSSGRNSVLGGASLRGKNARHVNVGLTAEEHAELVHKILADLRPASHVSRPASRAFSSTTTIASAHQRLAAANKMSTPNTVADKKRLSASSQSDASHPDNSSSKVSAATTPLLSQSRTSTPNTTPGLDAGQPADGAVGEDKSLLTPTAALESLRVLENTFQRSSLHLPRDEPSSTHDSKLSSPTTAVAASPTRSTIDDKDAGMAPRSKRNSSYRKSVPALNGLSDGVDALGISSSSHKDGSASPISDRAGSRASSLTASTETPSWISSLTALEAIRVLAFQQDVADALAPDASTAKNAPAAPAETSADEVSALRYALKFAIARADRLAEALNRANEDRSKVEGELEILRRNVLSMLGSRSMFGGGASGDAPSRRGARRVVEDEVLEEEDAEQFEDARSEFVEQPARRKPQPKQQKSVEFEPRTTTVPPKARPARAPRHASTTEVAPTKPTAPSGGVSIASLRAKAATAAAASPASQRYAPARTGLDAPTPAADPSSSEDEDEDDEDFDVFAFGKPTRRIAPEVSMADFLNASRMSKIEIEQHDARRELERALADDADRVSTNSRAPLTGSLTNRRGLFKSLTKMVDPRAARRASGFLAPPPPERDERRLNRTPSARLAHESAVLFGESIIPAYPGSVGRKGGRLNSHSSMSLSTSLRESLEKHGLREAGIRT
ncbi:conserved hypothetical protein [Sporisorium reilianum SRZ2]|uniref:Uncharacterized protein n=1 Tax=Sporisorium reilianum (strain SRZ2) TaxID=999809 RepID=E6ZK52_SPORE|nr:conserved hypothetical protein [Sporisorium reilianum SRZ2]